MAVASLGRGSPVEQTRPAREGEEILWLPWQWQHGAMAGEREINIHCKLIFVAS